MTLPLGIAVMSLRDAIDKDDPRVHWYISAYHESLLATRERARLHPTTTFGPLASDIVKAWERIAEQSIEEWKKG